MTGYPKIWMACLCSSVKIQLIMAFRCFAILQPFSFWALRIGRVSKSGSLVFIITASAHAVPGGQGHFLREQEGQQ